MNRLLISAAHKSSGKTTLAIGLCAALRRRGHVVQPFKKGPDYIDPMWLSLAAGRDCHNLDFYLMEQDEIRRTFARYSRGAGVAILEGNKGLYDGLDLDGSNSNAALAKLLSVPVVLVIDARGMTRGVAPLILGYQAFDRDIRIAGVILNQLGGARHESKLRAVIEHYTDVPVLGAVQFDERLTIVERHLGLVPSNEAGAADHRIGVIADAVAEHVDLDAVLAVAATAPALPPVAVPLLAVPPADVRIAVARDAAFGFYYAGDFAALRAAGAEIVIFDTLRDTQLPPADGLFIGGGFPEVQMQALEANAALRHHVRAAIERGLPVYAECGGLMYLTRSIRWQDRRCEMVGAIPADTVMHARPIGRGYIALRETEAAPWPATPDQARGEVRGHEFHYSSLENVAPDLRYGYEVMRGHGIDGRRDGIVYRNVFACYGHLRDLDNNPWAARFVEFVRRHKASAAARPAANLASASRQGAP
jgi:cobyrinic acid a,c-diamide synthase